MLRKNLTAALLVALGATAASPAFAASTTVTVSASQLGKATPAAMASRLNLGSGASYVATTASATTQRGSVKTREQQTFNGIPVYGRSVVVERDRSGNVLSVKGHAERGIVADLPSVTPRLSAAQAQSTLKAARQLSSRQAVSNAKSELFVYPGAGNKARLVYRTSFVVDSGHGMSRPTALIDASTGQIIKQWEGITNGRLPPGPGTTTNVQATGIGGNGATGSYYYDGSGAGRELLDVQRTGLTCYMQNDRVATYNLAGGQRVTQWSFGCGAAPYTSGGDAVNGAFSPINDAHHFGGVVHDMYTDWFGEPPLKNPDGSAMQLHMWVHYGVNYANAFWDGSEMVFGDNDGKNSYPFVVLDVTGHEISHGFTEQHSGLEYDAQSGGMNEAFSDMAGEAVKFFDRGSNDFLVGKDLINPASVGPGDLPSLRDMCTPSRDGASIDDADQYDDSLDVHYSSGVYNRAFCLLAKTSGWDTRKAFEVFHDANALYWQPNETFDGGACGVEQAATDRGYSAADVTAAFATVKVTCDQVP
ncbi:peptidase M4 [Frateuria sp. Soil773]|uniref:M4 family metallopeptidase n=1 Tax=Frateuria sp. Soil773 TaxID=1736407 RepID=UPI0006F57E6E|nr:M4 family metallopeptidase [Frateuria sp. Soil773]KRE92415.1 peptidase M4 [Frateuria sp. Soil773]